MNTQTHDFLTSLGFQDIGEDPNDSDDQLYHIDLTPIHISVPKAGCPPHSIVKLIWAAGGRKARHEIHEARERYLRALAI